MSGFFSILMRTWIILSFFDDKLFLDVNGFAISHQLPTLSPMPMPITTTTTVSSPSSGTSLFAAGGKKKKKKNRSGSGGGTTGTSTVSSFGGAAMEPCPCGVGETYSSCCGKVHKDINTFRSAAAEQVVRARYSAYAKKNAEFLIKSTHPTHKDFDNDLKRWKQTIQTNMYDNFDMPKCIIVEEKYNDDEKSDIEKTSTVQFIAEMVLRETGETTSFMETSTFQRSTTNGPWLYLSGNIEAVPKGGDDDDDDNDNKSTNEKDLDGDDTMSMEEKIASML